MIEANLSNLDPVSKLKRLQMLFCCLGESVRGWEEETERVRDNDTTFSLVTNSEVLQSHNNEHIQNSTYIQ